MTMYVYQQLVGENHHRSLISQDARPRGINAQQWFADSTLSETFLRVIAQCMTVYRIQCNRYNLASDSL